MIKNFNSFPKAVLKENIKHLLNDSLKTCGVFHILKFGSDGCCVAGFTQQKVFYTLLVIIVAKLHAFNGSLEGLSMRAMQSSEAHPKGWSTNCHIVGPSV